MSDLIDHDAMTGISTYHDYDHNSKKTSITHSQDVEKILDNNKKLANNDSYKREGIKNGYYHIGTIPMTVALDWKTKHGVDVINDSSAETLRRAEKLLASPEYAYLRTVNKI